MPTRRGIALLVSAVGLYLQARLLGIDELYGLAVAALLFPLAAVAFVRWGRHRIGFTRTISPQRVFADAPLRVTVTAHNHGRLASPPLFLEDDAPPGTGGAVRAVLPSLPPGRREAIALERRPTRRGRFAMGPMRAQLSDPFGLAEVSASVAPVTHVTVYPRVDVLSEIGPPETRGGVGRSAIQRLAIAGDEFYAVRGWQDGDDLRKIHWRSSARRDELMIRQEEDRPFPHATILLDTRAAAHRDGAHGSSLEWSISGAASVIWELSRQGFALRLATPDTAPTGSRWGREAADPLLTTLATLRASNQRSITHAARRVAVGPSANGALVAFMPPPRLDEVPALGRLPRAYSFAGAVLLDTPSFAPASMRERGAFDQRLADAERTLARAGWRVVIASSSDRIRDIWQRLLGTGAPRSRSQSPLS